MNRLRNMRGLVRILLAVLVAAQVAGVLSSPLAKAAPGLSGVGSQVHHQHAHGGAGHHQTDQKSSFTEHCCALHAIFVGTVCQTVGLEASAASCTRVVPANDLGQHAGAASRLDRPPRTIA
jgi:hypothetical protein